MPRTSKYPKAEMRAAYMASNMTAPELAEKFNVPVHYCEKFTRGWDTLRAEIRKRIEEKAIVKFEEKQAEKTSKDWERLMRANDAALAQIYALFSGTMDDGGKVIKGKNMSAGDVAKVVNALEGIMKNKSFLQGGPTERVESRNVHADLLDILDELKREKK